DDDDDDEASGNGNGAACSPERAWSHSETWPGRAPCWRHDDFPYVTVSEVFDAAAGVRIIARDCFMLETLSVHIRPKIRVQGVDASGSKTATSPAYKGRRRRRSSSGSSSSSSSAAPHNQTHGIHRNAAGNKGGATTQGPDGQEVQFADDMWSEIMAKGFICGDERWLVGEDAKGDVTILVF
ncbi:f-box domain, partial [Trichoderma arundinaceum]